MSEGDHETSEQRQKRKRLKKVCSQIREQVEFYFSDANLQKDRFLKKQIEQSEDGYIDLSLLTGFKKLKALTTDVSVIAKALARSESLVVKDKVRVGRKYPIQDPKDTDERTVYVECLPTSADHEWVKQVFSGCGQVLYVSLPRYHSTKDIKGFAFVEFGTTEAAESACKILNNPPADAADKPGKFPRGSRQFKQLQKQIGGAQKPTTSVGAAVEAKLKKLRRRRSSASESGGEESGSIRKLRKRRRSASECSDRAASSEEDGQTSPIKRPRVTGRDGLGTRRQSDGDGSGNEKGIQADCSIQRSDETVEMQSAGGADIPSTDQTARKKNLKRKAPDVEPDDGKGDEAVVPDGTQREGQGQSEVRSPKKVRISDAVDIKLAASSPTKRHRNRKRPKDKDKKVEMPELRVIPKLSWLELRDEYLKLQKASMKQFKDVLRQRQPQHSKTNTEVKDMDGNKVPQQGKTIEFVSDVIVKINSTTPMDRKRLKESLPSDCQVAYADFQDQATEGYIRCHSAEGAQQLAKLSLDNHAFALLTGEDEKQYWNKLQADRTEKLSSKKKGKKRGRDTNIKRAEKIITDAQKQQGHHVVFDD